MHKIVFLFLAGVALGCPRFVEFFPDPTEVPDQQGEFVEIRLQEVGDIYAPESLWIQFEEKSALAFPYPKKERLVLVHDSSLCPSGVACGLLGSIALPNSRESFWRLWAGSCRDSVSLPAPKAGLSFQRVKYSDEWVLTDATLGRASPQYEEGVKDCGIRQVSAEFLGKGMDLKVALEGCDSTWVRYQVEELYSGKIQRDSVLVWNSFALDSLAGEAFRIQVMLPLDDAPQNDTLDTLVFVAEKSPLVISEIHHCPSEPEPEWVEVYNRGSVDLPLEKLRFCNRGGLWSGQIAGGESLVFTKDTAGLRSYMGFREVHLLQVALGYLSNTGGSISICRGSQVLDSARWDKGACPAGINPLTMMPENTPGYQSSRRKNTVSRDFLYKLSSRVLRKSKTPFWIYVEWERDVFLRLLDSAGQPLWKMTIPAQSDNWWNIPTDSLDVGVAYVSLSDGKKEKMIGILVRP